VIEANTLFINFEGDQPVQETDLEVVAEALREQHGIEQGWIMTPAHRKSSQASDTAGSPRLVVEIDFSNPLSLQAILMKSAAGDDFLSCFSSLRGFAEDTIVYQTMARRHAFSPDQRICTGSNTPCTYLVQYPGRADNLDAWLDYFDRVHSPILARLPDVRAVTSFRPVAGSTTSLPWRPGHAMQRNKVVFDDVDALEAALASPELAEVRADAARFPSYAPGPTRHAMHTRIVSGVRGK
jgi:EthD domain